VHVGLIAGIGPAATDHYYRGLIDRHVAAGTTLDLTMAHADVRTMGRNLMNGQRLEQAKIFATLIERLQQAGAQLAAITSMGGHFCFKELEPISPLPLVNGVPAVDAAIAKEGYKTVGIIGTRQVMETRLYGGIASAKVIAPEGAQRDAVAQAYTDMATAGRVTEAQRQIFFSAGRDLCRSRGAEVVLLGGTDLFLAFSGQDCGFPVMDAATVHVEAIYRRSLA